MAGGRETTGAKMTGSVWRRSWRASRDQQPATALVIVQSPSELGKQSVERHVTKHLHLVTSLWTDEPHARVTSETEMMTS
jgi:hypothetical protein